LFHHDDWEKKMVNLKTVESCVLQLEFQAQRQWQALA